MELPGSVAQRRLGRELMKLRLAAELSRPKAAARINLAPSTLGRIEGSIQVPHRRTLLDILDMYGASTETRAALLALRERASNREAGGWLEPYLEDLPPAYADYIGLEIDAEMLQVCESVLIPGLIQTEDYARAVLTALLPTATASAIERRLAVRMQRQGILSGEEPVRYEAVVDEAALWRVVGSPAVMSSQLRALINLGSNVKLQVVPYGRGAHPGMLGSLVIVKFRDTEAPDVALIESAAGHLLIEESGALSTYHATYKRLQRMALSRRDSVGLIEAVVRDHERKA